MLRILLMGEHMNAVDENDNLVGFSTSDDCCAHGGWFVAPEIITDSEKFSELEMYEEQVFPHHVFDTEFFQSQAGEKDYDSDGVAIFKLQPYGWELDEPVTVLYLHLFNCHNGYYGKGFSYNFQGKRIEGRL